MRELTAEAAGADARSYQGGTYRGTKLTSLQKRKASQGRWGGKDPKRYPILGRKSRDAITTKKGL